MSVPDSILTQLMQEASLLTNTLVQNGQDLERALNTLAQKQAQAQQNFQTDPMWKAMHDTLRQLLNLSQGKGAGTALNRQDLAMINNVFSGKTQDLSNYLKMITQHSVAMSTNANSLKYATQMAKALGVSVGVVNKAILDSKVIQKREQSYKDAVNADNQARSQLGILGQIKWRLDQANLSGRKAQFQQIIQELKKQDPTKYQGKYGQVLAEEEAANRMRANNSGPTADLLSGAPNQPGGSAAQATMMGKFAKMIGTAISNSSVGQRLQNMASEGATLGALAIANKFPMLQSVMMGAIALGIPQAVGPLLGALPNIFFQLLSTKFGQGLLSRGLQGASGLGGKIVGSGFVQTIGIPALAGLVGLVGGKLLLNFFSGFADKFSANKRNAEGNKALIGGIGAVLGGALVAALVIAGAPVWAVVGAIGLTIAGIWHLIQHWMKFSKEEKDHPSWWDSFKAWFSTSKLGQFLGLGPKDANGDPVSSDEVVPSVIKSNVWGGLKTLYGEDLIDTHQYTKEQLNAMLPKSKAYESIANGGKGWSTNAASFQNDVMFAARGTGQILDSVIAKNPDLFGKLIVTSAYGSKSSPHSIGNKSHYVGGGKLDFSLAGMNDAERKAFQKKLLSTGYFEFANIEKQSDGGYHIDAKIKENQLKKMSDDAMKADKKKKEQENQYASPIPSNYYSDKTGTQSALNYNLAVGGGPAQCPLQ